MYEHYERHRTDNITDPALRRAHPISTISGWDRDHDQSTENSTKNGQASNDKAITNESQSEQSYKVSKSEQTDDVDVVDLENVKCICEENSNQDDVNISNSTDTTKEPSAQILNSNESNKPMQSISSISQVYNEQLTGQTSIVCNGDSEHAFDDNDDDDGTTNTSTKQVNASGDGGTSELNALRKTLEIDSYDMNEENSKEIVDEIVEEILTKSEHLLDDCKRSLDENHQHLEETETTSSPVIKDEEIEHAVSEVVKGVRNIERKVKRDSENDTDSLNIGTDTTKVNQTEQPSVEHLSIIPSTESFEIQNENQKTELAVSTAAIDETNDILNDDIEANENENSIEKTTTNTESDEIKDIVTTIVNDVIENCVNQTVTNNIDACDNDVNMSIIDNINNNNNSSEITTNDSNDNAIIVGDTITQTTEIVSTVNATPNEANATEETNEEIIKGIVDEIVDKCVESEAAVIDNNDDNNNNNNEEDITSNKAGNETFASADAVNESLNGDQSNNGSSAKATTIADNSANENTIHTNDNRNNKPNRSQGTSSISTSTQVENNHFGNLACTIELIIIFFLFFICN